MTSDEQTRIEAATFRRLLKHLDDNKQVQNIDLMILADFCRNCLAKWYSKAAADEGVDVDYEAAREAVYGMPYSEWKEKHQLPATAEQLAAMEAKKKKTAGRPFFYACSLSACKLLKRKAWGSKSPTV